MILSPKSFRDSLNLDSFERAIVWSALLLRDGYVDQDYDSSLKNSFRLQGQLNSRLRGELGLVAEIPVSNEVLVKGGNFFESVTSLAGAVDYSGEILPASNFTLLPITLEPATVNTLEEYFIWACQQLLASDLSFFQRLIKFEIIYQGNLSTYTLKVTVTLEYSYATFLANGDLISAFGVLDLLAPTPEEIVQIGTTDNLPEGVGHLYYTPERVHEDITVDAGSSGITYSDGFFDFSNVQASGVDHVETIDNGDGSFTLIFWEDLAKTISLGSVVLTNGVDGSDGLNGANGADGLNGANGADGADGLNGAGVDHITAISNGNGTHTVTFWGDTTETIDLGFVILSDGTDGAVSSASALTLTEQVSSPSEENGKLKLYAKTDKKLYYKDDSGLEQELGGVTGSGAASIDDIWLYSE